VSQAGAIGAAIWAQEQFSSSAPNVQPNAQKGT
jgi:hypothetical protein